jgi:polar amino acid transport system substrate-binding protein
MRPLRSLACAIGVSAFIAVLLSSCGDARPAPAAAAVSSTTAVPSAPVVSSAPAPAPAAPAGQVDLHARIMAGKTVRVGVKTDTAPFGMLVAGNYVGFDIDIAQALADRLGIEHVVFVPVTSGDRSDKLVAGEVDMVVASMTITRYREKRVDFTIPYFQDGQSILVKADSPIHSYLDLGGHTVGCVKGSTSSYYMKQVSPDAKVELFADFPALQAALDGGKVEAITSDLIILAGMVKNAPDPDAYRIAGERFTTEPYGIAVPQNQSAWRNAINHALLELWEEGRYQEIVKTWFGPGKKYQVPVNFAIGVYPK